ncbi:hypothetical protein [Streptomyces sp. NPDC056883]|uniref:hypothetical protein n=1 Tax=Streptomyces sp. NPDC056883 TaxID=3345959 RepID=UPI0036AF0525
MDDASDHAVGGQEIIDGTYGDRPMPGRRHRKPQMRQDWLMAPPPVGRADTAMTSYFTVEDMTGEVRSPR